MEKPLNLDWMVTSFITVLAETTKGGFAVLDKTWAEVEELKRLTYIKAAPSKHKEGNLIAFTSQKNAYVEDLVNDLGLNLDDYSDKIPAELRKMTHDNTAPQAPVFEQEAAPQAPVYPVDNSEEHVASADVSQLQPEFSETAQAAPQVAATEKKDFETVIGGDVPYDVLGRAESPNGEVDIEVGIPFQQRIARPSTAKKSAYPFEAIADHEIANPNSAPSFHIANRELKNLSGTIRRASETFEASHGITFRGRRVGADDPKGEGVRVFALRQDAVPARPSKKQGD